MAQRFRVISVSPRMNDYLKEEYTEFRNAPGNRNHKVSFIEFTNFFVGEISYGKKQEKERKKERVLIRF